MRRKAGTLVPLEVAILVSVLALQAEEADAYGFMLAKDIAGARGNDTLTSHGTLYKALGRLADQGLVESAWEDSAAAEVEGRPRRRSYRVTGLGADALGREHARLAAESESATRAVVHPKASPA